MEKFPLKIDWLFKPTFKKIKEAKEAEKETGGQVKKLENGQYQVSYFAKIPNVTTTGRQMYVIDEAGNLFKQVLTLIQSNPFDGEYKISGFDGIFFNRSNWHLDIYVSTNQDRTEQTRETITRLTREGKRDYETKMNQCRASKHILESLTKTDWEKAKDLNVI